MGQFTGIFNELEKTEQKPKASSTKRSASKQTAAEASAKALQDAKKGKPNGKQANRNAPTAAPMRGRRSHPDYTQAPAFVRKDTYKAVKIALLNGERVLDYSDLVQELLTAWLTNKK